MSKQLLKLPKNIKVVIFLLAILSIFSVVAKAAELSKQNVKLLIDEENFLYKTDKLTIEEFLKSEEIELDDLDQMSHDLKDSIENNMSITIKRAKPIKVIIDSSEERGFKTNEETLGKMLASLKKQDDCEYRLAEGYSSSSFVEKDMTINILTVKEEFVITKEEVPFETETVQNPEVEEGNTSVKVTGSVGEKEITTKYVYVGGELESSEFVKEEVIVQPINHVIEEGTKKVPTITTPDGNLIPVKTLTMKSTAYTAGASCTGKSPGMKGYGITASGMKAQRGVVAVDTSVIPFGTKLYVEGYGYAVAGDTGGAIKGNKIDLFFDSYSDAINYGVRNVTVHVLAD